MWLVGRGSETHPYRHPDVWAVLLTLAVTAPIAWRRRRPAAVMVFVTTAAWIYMLANYPNGLGWPAMLFAIYSFACHRRRRTDLWPVVIWGVEIALFAPVAFHRNSLASVAGLVAVSAVAWVAGDAIRARRVEHEQLRERAGRSGREREERARQALADERTRIARELHDVVAHALGVVVMQAAGARRLSHLDDRRSREVLANIEQTGRQAFGEMRRLVNILRDEQQEAAVVPQPALTDLAALAGQFRPAGLVVNIDMDGRPVPLPAGVELSAYRIIQEALTNTLKHGHAARARVRLGWSPACLDIEVIDDGTGGDPVATADGSGHGLVGMRERVQLYGGCLEAGPGGDGGYRVHAQLPLVSR